MAVDVLVWLMVHVAFVGGLVGLVVLGALHAELGGGAAVHRFLFETGLRVSEAIEVRFRDVDLGRRWLTVERQFYRGRVQLPKGRKRRRVRLGEPLARELWRLQAGRGGDDLVFTAERGGRIVPSNLMSRTLKPAAVRAGLGGWVGKPPRAETWVGFHTLRHTCATTLFRSAWNPAQVARFLGHSDPGFTLRTYVHLLDEDMPEPVFRPLDPVAAAETADRARDDVGKNAVTDFASAVA